MQRRWLLFTSILCALLVVASLFASSRPQRLDAVVERDGSRTIHRRVLGTFTSSRVTPDTSIHVTDDFKRHCIDVGLKLLPATLTRGYRVSRSFITEFQDVYNLYGTAPISRKAFIDSYAKQFPKLFRFTSATSEQISGTLRDGRTMLSISAFDDGNGQTSVNLSLTVVNPTPRKIVR